MSSTPQLPDLGWLKTTMLPIVLRLGSLAGVVASLANQLPAKYQTPVLVVSGIFLTVDRAIVEAVNPASSINVTHTYPSTDPPTGA